MTDRAVSIAVTVGLLLVVLSSGAVTAIEPATTGQAEPRPDGVFIQVSLEPDGSASWTIEHRILLDDGNTTAAFESLQRDVEANESLLADPFASRMEATVAAAANETGREMSVRNVSVGVGQRQLPQEYGVVSYRFTWTGFAVVNETTIRAGDALAGFFLDERTTLLVTWPADYTVTSASPTPDERRDRAVVWNGPVEFGLEEPSVVVERDATGATPTATPDDGETTTDTEETSAGDASDGSIGAGSLAIALAAIAVLGAGVWVAVRRRTGSEPAPGVAADADGDGDRESAPEPPSELLSNEERVLTLLRENDGRMKQQEVAESLDWTDAKTSQVVTSMRDEGSLESFRLGRENVLVLPERDQT
jgi:hypothetical protein